LYGPIFLIAFPLFGPQYPLGSPAEAIGTAILVETCGFSSGLVGYFRRNLIDIKLALFLALFSVPAAIYASEFLQLPEVTLKACYSLLMVSLGSYLLFFSSPADSSTSSEVNSSVDDKVGTSKIRTITDSDGNKLEYPEPSLTFTNVMSMLVGGTFTGLLGVGVGEIIIPQLLLKKIPVAVAAATSTLAVTLTVASCAGKLARLHSSGHILI
jgi:uncharacterized protein